MFLSQTARLTFPLQQAKNVAFSHRALDVADNCARGVVKKLNTDLGDSTSVSLRDFKRALELGVLRAHYWFAQHTVLPRTVLTLASFTVLVALVAASAMLS